jgi:7,8-dihydropterin-6-yl-methyl-4-(beta-D-ribofuranosyl)aminobenzene 5'-phosphate synthase
MLEDKKLRFFHSVSATNSLKLKILYDNEALNGFKGAFGFSCFIEKKGILFDTGGDVDTLFFNMQKFRVDPLSIRIIVLSHEHRDHTGGIQIINYCGKVDVFVPVSFSERFKGWLASHPNVRLHEIQELGEVCEGVFTTGELGQLIKEQSLIVKTGNGLTVITGCAHPGLENILRAVSKLGDIYGVVGGFHSFSKLEALKGMHLIVPCHCTVRKREIFNLYPKVCKKCSAGCTILI